MAIVSFDERGAFDLVDPPITSIKQPGSEIGELSSDILIDEIQSEQNVVDKTRMLEPFSSLLENHVEHDSLII